jgi:hypothetical protein
MTNKPSRLLLGEIHVKAGTRPQLAKDGNKVFNFLRAARQEQELGEVGKT